MKLPEKYRPRIVKMGDLEMEELEGKEAKINEIIDYLEFLSKQESK